VRRPQAMHCSFHFPRYALDSQVKIRLISCCPNTPNPRIGEVVLTDSEPTDKAVGHNAPAAFLLATPACCYGAGRPAAQQFRQLGDVGGDAPGLVVGRLRNLIKINAKLQRAIMAGCSPERAVERTVRAEPHIAVKVLDLPPLVWGFPHAAVFVPLPKNWIPRSGLCCRRYLGRRPRL
jgi:hypothetical protein